MANYKIKRACAMAAMLPRAEEEILASIPQELLDRLTSREIAVVMRSLNAHWHKACAWKEADVAAEGCVWDRARGKLREIPL